MVSKTLGQWNRSLGWFICSLALAFFGPQTARAQEGPGSPQAPTGQQTDQLQQQLQQLKQQYDATTRELTQRIAALEQEIEKQKEKEKQEKDARERAKQGTVSVAELAAQEAAKNAILGQSNEVGEKFQGQLPSEPTYDFLREADTKIEKLQQQVSSFEFRGYFRSGYGLNGQGGQQIAFEAPGAGAKYRLGNETETDSELIFVNNWMNPENVPGEAGPHSPLAQARVHSADYLSLQAIVKEFLAKTKKPACFAVAGPVIAGRVKTTNLPWLGFTTRRSGRQKGFYERSCN